MGGESSRPPFFLRALRRYRRVLPVPVRLSVSDPADVVTPTDAERMPTTSGLNVIVTVHEAPAASVELATHVPLRVNSAGFAPPNVSAVIVSALPPVFLTVEDLVPLPLPTTTMPRSSAVGVSVADAAAGAWTLAAACDTTNVLPPIVRFAERAAPVLGAAT